MKNDNKFYRNRIYIFLAVGSTVRIVIVDNIFINFEPHNDL